MKVGIVGSEGIVGSAVKYGMEKLGHEVSIHDIVLDTSIDDVLDTELCFICVPTPENQDGSCDSSIVEDVVDKLICGFQGDGYGNQRGWRRPYKGLVVIKSTVLPGTTERIRGYHDVNWDRARLCFVPEFLRERCAISDFTENHDVCVIGCNSDSEFELIKRAHGKYPKQFVKMTPTEAELTKYFSNVFNAMRVVFANGFYEVCQKLGADYATVKNAVVQRPTMLDLYLDCNEKFRGFAGVCLPKDTAAFAKLAENLDIDAGIFRVIVEDNKLYQPTVSEGMRIS